jgi:hypothetical protein
MYGERQFALYLPGGVRRVFSTFFPLASLPAIMLGQGVSAAERR